MAMYHTYHRDEGHPDGSTPLEVYRLSPPKPNRPLIRSASDLVHYFGPRLSSTPSPPLDRPGSIERHPQAPALHRRTTDLEPNAQHPYRPLQSEIVPVPRYGYSSHNPTLTMTSVETSPPQRSTKTRRREAWQIDILEAFYRHKHMPDKAEKEMLAARINDTLKYVNIWFQNRRQAAQKKGELRPRETYENWRNKRQGHSGMEYDEFPTPPEYSTSAASSSYFGQSYASQDMMLATPREMEEHRPPSVSSSMVASPPACQPAQSPFAFGLSAPLKTYDGSNPLPIPSDRSRPSYPPSRSYERPTYTPPYSAEGHSVASHPPPTYPVEYTRPEIARSISMRREAPGPSLSGFHLEEGRSSLLLPSLSGLESSSTFGKMPSPSTLLPRRESGGSNNEYSLSSARTEEMSPPSHLKLPPISSLALPDNDTWFSAIAARRS